MLYSTVPGALVMFFVNLGIVIFGMLTCGYGLILLPFSWIAQIVWAAEACKNSK